jgi:hypothetical protein
MRRSSYLRLAAPALALALLAGPALASSDRDDDVRLGEPVPAAEWLSVAEIAQRLETDGRIVTKVEADDGLYEVYFTEGGLRYEAKVHPRTAEILHRERD